MFYKLFAYDIQKGYRSIWKTYILLCVFCITVFLDFEIRKSIAYQEMPVNATYMDILFYVYGGRNPYTPSPWEKFILPVRWYLLYALLFYSVLNYPMRDFRQQGIHILLRCKKKKIWWTSKLLWTLSMTVFYFLFTDVMLAILCLISGETLDFTITPQIAEDIVMVAEPAVSYSKYLSIAILILPVFLSAALSLLQLLGTLFIKTIEAYGIILILLLAAAYFDTRFLPAIYLMPMKSAYAIQHGFTITEGMVTGFAVISLSFFLGWKRIEKYDFL